MADAKPAAKPEASASPAKQPEPAPAPAKAVQPTRAFCQQSLQVLDFDTPEDGVEEGHFYKIGAVTLFASVTAAKGRTFRAVTAGLFNSVPKKNANFAQGDAVGFDGESFVSANTSAPACGYAVSPADKDDDTARIMLTGQVG